MPTKTNNDVAGIAHPTKSKAVSRTTLTLLLVLSVGLVSATSLAAQDAPRRLARVSHQESLPIPKNALATRRAPWWQNEVRRPLRIAPKPRTVSLESLIIEALQYSPRVKAISDRSLIRRETIVEADAEFDVHAFMESKFVRTSEPVGSLLTTGPGGSSRFREEDWYYNGGLRKRTRLGGSVELSQQIGALTSNSTFLFPPQQGNSRLALSFKQPLLNGAGRVYSESLIVLAEIDTRAAGAETLEELQDHLLEVTRSYWELHLHRATLVQKIKHHERATSILTELQARRDFDSLESEIHRAEAAVATRHAELIRAAAMIRNAQARIRALVSGPNMVAGRDIEMVPFDVPTSDLIEVKLDSAIIDAVQNRPEIDQAMQHIRAANVRLKVAKNELLPALDMVLESYVSGLDGNYDVAHAWGNQFSVGEPSYTAGLSFEVPLYNRAAHARRRRRHLELRQLTNRLQATMEALSAEVEVAVREVQTAHGEMIAKRRAMTAAEKAMNSLHERLRADLSDDVRFVSADLANLLDAQDRLSVEEFAFADAQRAYAFSLTALRRATGTLLQHEQITSHVFCDRCLPRKVFDKRSSETFKQTSD